MSVPGHTLTDHPSIQQVQRCEQGSSSMPLVVVGHGPTAPLLHGQAGLCALEGLDLAFLVNTQDQGLVGRIEVQPTTSVSFSVNRWSLESLNRCIRWGWSP